MNWRVTIIVILVLFSVSCSEDLNRRLKGADHKNVNNDDTPDSILDGDSSDRDDDERPTNIGEGVPGYLRNPHDVEVTKTEGKVTVKAKAGSVVAESEVVMEVYAIPKDDLEEEDKNEDGSYTISTAPTLTINILADGSFQGDVPIEGDDVVLILCIRDKDEESGDIAVDVVEEEMVTKTIVDISEDDPQTEALDVESYEEALPPLLYHSSGDLDQATTGAITTGP